MAGDGGDAERIARALDATATRLSDGSWSCRCPAHEDRDPSLSIDWKDGTLVWHCYAGCSQADVQAELKRRGLLGKPNGSTYEAKPNAPDRKEDDWRPIVPVPDGTAEPTFTHHRFVKPTATWCYRGPGGETLFHVARFDPQGQRKQILPRVWGTLNGATGWHWKHPLEPRPLYGLDRLAERLDAPVLIVEGEKTADAAAELLPEHVAVTWEGGGNAVDSAYWRDLERREVTIWPDADEAGRKAAKAVSATLKDIAASVRIVDLPADLPKSWDLADPPPEGGLDVMGMLSRAREPEPEWKSELRIIRPTEWQGRPAPERRWRVKNWLLEAIVAALYGDGGVGKSLLLQQLLTSCAIGVPWLGLETKPCKAIGFFCEDSDEELWRRQEAINQMYGCDMKDLGNLQLVSREYMEIILMDFTKDGIGEATALHGHLMSWAKDFGAELIGVDTAADTFGGSEIVRVQVRQFIQKCLGALVRETGGTVVLAAHPSVAGMRAGTGGSTGWNNSVRARLHLKRPETENGVEPDRDARILELPKSNYGPDGTQLRLRWVEGALRPESNASAGAPGGNLGNTTMRAEMVFLKLLAEFAAAGIYVGNSKQGKYAPRDMAASPNREGFRVQDFETAMRGLIAKKRIKLEKKGRSMAFVTCDPGEAAPEDPYDFNEEAA